MMMEAIRLSLASEEDRRKKEEKEARKEAKKKEKENKKAEKAGRKNSLFTLNSNTSYGDGSSSLLERSRSNLSLTPDDDSISGKGKAVERNGTPPQEVNKVEEEEEAPRPSYVPALSLSGTSQESLASSIPIPTAAEPFRRSHLRQMSNASSASSSYVEPGPPVAFSGSGTPPPGSLEPMFNFRSLAAMIGEDEKAENSAHVEHADGEPSPTTLPNGKHDYPLGKDEESRAPQDLRATSPSDSDSPKVTENDSGLGKGKPVIETSAAMSDV